MASGCFYIGPPWSDEVNRAPTIEASNVNDGRIVLVNSPQQVFLQFEDQDGDTITVRWLVDGLQVTDPSRIILERDSDELWSAFLLISTQNVHDGSEVNCFYSDGKATLSETMQVDIP